MPDKFAKGDRFMLALHGLCAVTETSVQDYGGKTTQMVTLQPQHGTYTIQIPLGDVARHGLRQPLDGKTLLERLQAPAEPLPPLPPRNIHRTREWSKMLRDGDVSTSRRVLLELAAAKRRQKTLSPDEQRLLERVQDSLCEEISVALGVEFPEAQRMLSELMADPPQFAGQVISMLATATS